MGLVKVKQRAEIESPSNNICSLIQRKRYQILVHSLLYYELDYTLISDERWIEVSKELVDLQDRYPQLAKKVIFHDAFKDFDGSTGFNLPYRDDQIIQIAGRLLRMEENQAPFYELQRIPSTPSEYRKERK